MPNAEACALSLLQRRNNAVTSSFVAVRSHRTPYNGAHFEYAQLCAVAQRSKKQAVQMEWGRRDSVVRSSTAMRVPLARSDNVHLCSKDAVIGLLRLYKYPIHDSSA